MLGLIGYKIGLTRIFKKNGDTVPISIIKIINNKISYIKNIKKDGYNAIQVSSGKKNIRSLNRAEAQHLLKNNISKNVGILKEFRIDKNNIKILEKITLGQELTTKIFKDTKLVNIRVKSKGKGFQGTVKKYNFKTQDATHGNSLSHRALGSTGQCQDAGRVFKGKKMPSRMGNNNITLKKQKLFSIDEKENLLLIQGIIPGFIGSCLKVSPYVKNS